MDDRQVRDAVTAVELTAGVVTSSYGNSGGPFAGRGIGTGDSFNIRGVDLNESRDIRLDGFSIPGSSFDMGAYERIEVVKGPSGTLYGQGSLGGFVNFISKRPTSEPFASATTQLGSFNTRRLEADAGGPITPDFKSWFSAVYDDLGLTSTASIPASHRSRRALRRVSTTARGRS